MKNKMKKSLAILLAFMMVFTAVGVQMPVTVQAETKVALSCKKKTVAVDGTYTLTVQGVNDKNATYAWSSSDKKVATVSKAGVVTGVAEGSTTIKCKITMSDKSTKTLSCKVTVKEQKVATSVKISNAKLDENNVHTIVVGESYDFNRKLSPSKSNDKTYWYIEDEEYAEVDSNGVVTAKKAGTTTLIAKTGIDRVSAEESGNKVVDSVRLKIVEPSVNIPEFIQKISKASLGDYVTFGTYEQDNKTGNGAEAIEWQVLDKKDGKVLLLSKYALDAKSYHKEWADVTWETCDLRNWLNEDFYKTAFTSAEQKYIAETYVINEDNPYWGSDGGNNTYDKVFLLSIDEVTTYFDSDPDAYNQERSAKVTEYAKAQGGWYNDDKESEYYSTGWWWLRSPGRFSAFAAGVYYAGVVDRTGNYATFYDEVVRPAIWVEVESSATETVTPESSSDLASVEKISKASIGDYVTFGTYEQDNKTGNGAEAIEWQVLDKKDGKVLLLSKYALDCKPYHEESADVTWETCTLRSWLNEDFYKTAFTSAEQKYIAETYVINEDNPYYGTDGGNNTYDNVFLLSIDEVTTYFDEDPDAEDPARRAQVTEYAKAQGGWYSDYYGNGWWWLRSPGIYGNGAAGVDNDGYVYCNGGVVVHYGTVVRPAIWVEVESSATETVTPESSSDLASVEKISKASVGDYVTFGTYEQDNKTGNGAEAIEWQVLDKKDGKVLLLSKYALDCKPYNEGWADVTWETCTLRSWLNEDFYKTAFTSVEQKYIAETYVINEDNPYYRTDGGNNTYDNVFLLSIDEVTTYFDSNPDAYDPARRVQVTEYARVQGGWYSESDNYYGNGPWWLRSPGHYNICTNAVVVVINGSVHFHGNEVDNDWSVVRPALWVEVE